MISEKFSCLAARDGSSAPPEYRVHRRLLLHLRLAACLLLVTAAISHAREKKDVVHYGAGLIVNIPLPVSEVEPVVEEVSENTIIRGTKEYNKDEYVAKAVAVKSTPVFPAWKEGGKVFYKVRTQALDPRNFKDGGDVGTLAVRYVVQPQGDNNTILRIDALFVEDFRRTIHTSNGSVESSEYKDIQDHLAAVELVKKETAEALEAKQERAAKAKLGMATDSVASSSSSSSRPPEDTLSITDMKSDQEAKSAQPEPDVTPDTSSAAMSTATSRVAAPVAAPLPTYERQPGQSLEQHLSDLRHEVERLVKKPGAPLQSAPFHTASTLKSLDPGAEVLILISTPYWFGVETREGEHGWIRRDQLEMVP